METNTARLMMPGSNSHHNPNSQKEPAIRINNLNVYANHQHILTNINVNIPKNEITVLLGPSGCGKTTLLKTMCKLTDLYPELTISGSVRIGEKDILAENSNIPLMRQKMGLLSQKPFPLPFSIYKNVSYAVKLKGVKDKGLIAWCVEKKLREVGLWHEVKDRLNSSADSLSIGQQQRLCLARGLAVKPMVILADEPTSALDPTSSKKIENLFRELKKHYTIVVVTHILRQARRLADNVVFMSEGQVIETGTPGKLFNHPESPQLKEYLVDGS